MKNNCMSCLKEKISGFLSRMLALVLAVLTLGSVFVGVFEPMEAAAEEEEPDYSSWNNYNLTNWMDNIPGYYQISQLNIPATHDSCTTYMSSYSNWSRCQKYYIDEQLVRGIRVFDIRLDFDQDEGDDIDESFLVMTHNGYNCLYKNKKVHMRYIEHVLQPCLEFVKEHDSETVVLRVCREGSRTYDQDEDYKIRQKRKIRSVNRWFALANTDYVLYPSSGEQVPLLKDARGKIVILETWNSMETSYEMEYDEVDADGKIKRLKHCFDTSPAINRDYKDVFIEQGLRNMGQEGNPYVKIVGTNVNRAGKFGPFSPAIDKYSLPINTWLKGYNFQMGKRYGWISMDFPHWYKLSGEENETEDGKEIVWKIIKSNPTLDELSYTWCYTEDNVLHFYSGFIKEEELKSRLSGKTIIDLGSFDDKFPMGELAVPWYKYRSNVSKVVIEDEIHPKYLNYWFNTFTSCIDFNLQKLRTDKTVDYSYLFADCRTVKALDLRSFSGPVNNNVRVDHMFYNDTELRTIFANPELDFGKLNYSSPNSPALFYGDCNLTGGLGTKCPGTADIADLKYACVDRNDPEKGRIEGYFTKYVEDPPIYWKISDGTLSISSQNPDQTWSAFHWKGLSSGISVPNWYDYRNSVKKVTVTDPVFPKDLSYWFLGFSNAESFELENLVLIDCAGMNGMFKDCARVQELYLAGWAKSLPCNNMFENCSALRTIYVDPGFSMTDQHNAYGKLMFDSCTNLVGQNGTKYSDAKVSNATYALIDKDGSPGYFTEKQYYYWGFSETDGTLHISGNPTQTAPFPFEDIRLAPGNYMPWYYETDLSKIKTARVENRIAPRHLSYWFAELSAATDISVWNLDVSRAEDMEKLFYNVNVETLNLGGWEIDKSKLKNVNQMFATDVAQDNNLKRIFTEAGFDLTEIEEGKDMFTGRSALTGKKGTMLKDLPEGHPDQELAWIDSEYHKGLFTNELPPTIYWGLDEETKTLSLSGNYSEKTPNGIEDSPRWPQSPFPLDKTETVKVIGELQPLYTTHWFDTTYLESADISFDLALLDTSKTLDMSYMFAGPKNSSGNFSTLDLENFSSKSLVYAKSMFEDSDFARILVSDEVGKDFDLTDLDPSDCRNIFAGCENLIGEDGTRYESEKVDIARALYGGKNGKPGYFTRKGQLKYFITFNDYDDSLPPLQVVPVAPGVTPSYTGETPEMPAYMGVEYTFTGWNPELVPADKDAVYNPVFEGKQLIYTAVFQDADGKELERHTFTFDEDPTGKFKGELPTKEATKEKRYEFESWAVKETIPEEFTVILEPQFREITIKYHVYFKNYDGQVWYEQDLEYQQLPEYQRSEKPTKPDDMEYSYSFKGWVPEIVPITEDGTTYTAQYDKTPLEYQFTEGMGTHYKKGSSKSWYFKVSGPTNYLISGDWLFVDDRLVTNRDYYLGASGNRPVLFTLLPKYLKTLGAGWHTVTVKYQNGSSPSTNFYIEDPDPLDVEFYNCDTNSGFLLEGAQLELRQKLPENSEYTVEISKWTSSAEEPHLEKNLGPGEYKLIETAPPPDYYENPNPIFFYIDSDMKLWIWESEKPKPVESRNVIMFDNPKVFPTPQEISFAKTENDDEKITTVDKAEIVFTGTDVNLDIQAAGATAPAPETEAGSGTSPDPGTAPVPPNYEYVWSTEKDKNLSLLLYPGTYLMTERETPAGYYTAEDIIFRVIQGEDGNSKKPDDLLVWNDANDSWTHELNTTEDEKPLITMKDPKKIPEVDVEFAKEDSDGNLLAGAKLKVVDADNGTVVGSEWTTTTDKKDNKILKLWVGTFELIEETAPAGYWKAQNIRFRVEKDKSGNPVVSLLTEKTIGGVKTEVAIPQAENKIVMKDIRKDPVKITFSKTDAEGSPLGGAQLKVTQLKVPEEEAFSKSWTTNTKTDEKLELWLGEYQLTEEKAPEGYSKAEPVLFRVIEDPLTGKLTVERTDEKDAEGGEQDYPEDDHIITMIDLKKPITNVIILKDDEKNQPLSGATLKVTELNVPEGEEGFSETWTTGEDGEKELNLWVGTYQLTEEEAPTGYRIAEPITFRVRTYESDDETDEPSVVLVITDESGEEIEEPVWFHTVTMTDELKPKMKVTVSIIDENNVPLGGAKLKLTADADFSDEWTTETGKNREVELWPGEYLLTEETVPEGQLKADDVIFKVKEDPETGTLSLVQVIDGGEIPVDSVVMKSRARVQYKIIEGADSTYTLGSNKTHHFRSNAPYAKFTSVEIDGKTVDPANYTVSEGSTNADFKGSYMETLSVGTHSITMLASDGSASANFKVAKRPDPTPTPTPTTKPTPTPVPTSNPKKGPQTGDSSNVAPWLSLMLFSAAAVFLTMSKTKKFGILLKKIFK